MKKIAFITTLLLLSSALFSAPRFGYSVSGKGATLDHDYGGVSIGAVFEPFSYGICRMEASTTIGFDSLNGFCLSSFDVGLSTPLFRILSPFDFLFVNKALWAPTLKGMATWNSSFDLEWAFSLSLLHFEDSSFRYDFLSPFLLVNKSFDKFGYGFDVLKISYVF